MISAAIKKKTKYKKEKLQCALVTVIKSSKNNYLNTDYTGTSSANSFAFFASCILLQYTLYAHKKYDCYFFVTRKRSTVGGYILLLLKT